MKRKDYCKWVDFDGDWSGNFETECGSAFTLITGDPIDNHIVFCPYCGGEVIYERTAIDSASRRKVMAYGEVRCPHGLLADCGCPICYENLKRELCPHGYSRTALTEGRVFCAECGSTSSDKT